MVKESETDKLIQMAITPSEWLVMQVLWDKGPLKMADIVSALSQATQWSRTTVLTLARRLEDKGAIGTERSNKAFIYAPLVSQKEAQRESVRQYMAQFFNSDPYQLVKCLVDARLLDKDEMKKLRDRAKSKKN